MGGKEHDHSGADCAHAAAWSWGLKAQVRQDWGHAQDNEPADWLELFYDLFIAAFAVNLSSMLSHSDLGLESFRLALLYATIYFEAWSYQATLRSCIALQGALWLFLFCVSLVGLAGSAAELHPHYVQKSFVLWRFVTYGSNFWIALIIAVTVPRAKRMATHTVCMNVLAPAILHVCIMFAPEESQIAEALMWVAMAVHMWCSDLFYLSPITRACVDQPPLNIHHYSERVQLFVMILTGEMLIAVCSMTADNHDPELRLCGVVAVVSSFCLAFLFFNAQPHAPADFSMRLSRQRAFFYRLLIRILSLSILIVGCALKSVLYILASAGGSADHRRLGGGSGSSSSAAGADDHGATALTSPLWCALRAYSLSYGVAIMCIVLIRFTHWRVGYHPHDHSSNTRLLLDASRVFALLLGMVLWLLTEILRVEDTPVIILVCVCFHALVLVLIDFFSMWRASHHFEVSRVAPHPMPEPSACKDKDKVQDFDDKPAEVRSFYTHQMSVVLEASAD